MTARTFFKIGQKVMIYEDPLTEKKPEGEAILMRHNDTVHYGIHAFQAVEEWMVCFVGPNLDGKCEFIRTIKRKSHISFSI